LKSPVKRSAPNTPSAPSSKHPAPSPKPKVSVFNPSQKMNWAQLWQTGARA
jgi:hypothetical protein